MYLIHGCTFACVSYFTTDWIDYFRSQITETHICISIYVVANRWNENNFRWVSFFSVGYHFLDFQAEHSFQNNKSTMKQATGVRPFVRCVYVMVFSNLTLSWLWFFFILRLIPFVIFIEESDILFVSKTIGCQLLLNS